MTRASRTLAIAVAAWTAVMAAAGSWKYAHYGYAGVDLAYFAQVFWNTVHGSPFLTTIHPHLSLGDHAELAIPLLAIPYALWQDPRMLLAMQAFALALPAVPLCLIARRRLAGTALERLGPPAIAAAWLLNPAVQNVAAFEFHVLPFALVPLCFALLAYERERKLPFLLWTVAALLVREDVAIVVMMIGVLAMIERRRPWWIFAPFLLGIAWITAAMRLIARFAPAGGYKFSSYYSWLGAGPFDAASNAAANLDAVLAHVATHANLELVVGLALPLLFLPFARPTRLVLALGPFLQILLSAQGGGALIFQTHYATLFLPGLFLAAIDGLRVLPDWFGKRKLALGPREAAAGLLVAAVYGMATLGPLPGIAAAALDPDSAKEKIEGDAIVAAIPDGEPVAASYRLLPKLASRRELYSLHYQFLGVTQFAERPYAIPEHVAHAAFDRRDLLTYRAQYEEIGWARPHLEGGEGRLRALFGTKTYAIGPYEAYARGGSAVRKRDGIRYDEHARADVLHAEIPVPDGLPDGAVLRLELAGAGRSYLRDLPASATTVEIAETFPGIPRDALTARAQFQRQRAWYELDDARTALRRVIDVAPLGPPFGL